MDGSSAGLRRRNTAEATDMRDPTATPPPQVPRPPRKRKGFAVSRTRKPSKAPSSSSSMASSTADQPPGGQKRDLNVVLDEDFLDLARLLGTSFAAVLSQVLCDKVASRDLLPADKLSMMCTSAVKGSVSNIHGDRFDSFLNNFEKSFDTNLKTLLLLHKASRSGKKNRLRDKRPLNVEGDKLIEESYNNDEELGEDEALSSTNQLALHVESNHELVRSSHEELGEDEALSSTNQLALHDKSNHELVRSSHNLIAPTFSQSMLTTFTKSVTEQTRSNDLKEVEIGLTMRKLQMKQSQLAMSSDANWLEKVKISMNMSKAAFKKEKLRNQIEDSRHAELIRRCIDLLVSGLILMCAFLVYGASIFSYQRITEATSSCTAMSRGSKSWWMPKQMSSVSSGWQMLRCHAMVITRMLFGLLMILVMAYSLLQRSAASTMPITSILFLLGFACGIAGKLCVDSLGGSGYHWVIYWELLCSLHLFANIFPSVLYRLLYGHVLAAQSETTVWWLYRIRRYTFYVMLLLVLPTMAGLLPFGSMMEWKDHFTEKMRILVVKAEQTG